MATVHQHQRSRAVIDRFVDGFVNRRHDTDRSLSFDDEALVRQALSEFLADEVWLHDDDSAQVVLWLVDQLGKLGPGALVPATILLRLKQETFGLVARIKRAELTLDRLREGIGLLSDANARLRNASSS